MPQMYPPPGSSGRARYTMFRKGSAKHWIQTLLGTFPLLSTAINLLLPTMIFIGGTFLLVKLMTIQGLRSMRLLPLLIGNQLNGILLTGNTLLRLLFSNGLTIGQSFEKIIDPYPLEAALLCSIQQVLGFRMRSPQVQMIQD